MPKFNWYGDDLANKTIRRDAANSFLTAILEDPDGLGASVTGLEPDKKQNARDEFDRILRGVPGGDALPQKVEVICIDPDTRKRANLVVFILHKEDEKSEGPRAHLTPDLKQPDTDLLDQPWVGRWVAAWAPY